MTTRPIPSIRATLLTAGLLAGLLLTGWALPATPAADHGPSIDPLGVAQSGDHGPSIDPLGVAQSGDHGPSIDPLGITQGGDHGPSIDPLGIA